MIKQPMVFAVLAVLAAAAILVIAIIAAHGAPGCMSKAEARAHFPRQHIYWHTLDHCWDNHPHQRRAKPSREPDGKIPQPALAAVHWYARSFEAVAALEPPVIITVIDHRWPGSNVIDAPIVIEPVTVVGAQEFNELDAQADGGNP
jgi:hypothetical protein